MQRQSKRDPGEIKKKKCWSTEIGLVGTNDRSFAFRTRDRHFAQSARRICADRMNERTAGTSANNIAAGPTDPDLTALTPFPALMTHRAAQLSFRANGTKSSAWDPLNPGSTLMLADTQPGRTITSLALTIERRDFRHNDPFSRLTRTCAATCVRRSRGVLWNSETEQCNVSR